MPSELSLVRIVIKCTAAIFFLSVDCDTNYRNKSIRKIVELVTRTVLRDLELFLPILSSVSPLSERSDSLRPEMSAFASLQGEQFTLSTQFTKPNYLVILSTEVAPQFLQKTYHLYRIKGLNEFRPKWLKR